MHDVGSGAPLGAGPYTPGVPVNPAPLQVELLQIEIRRATPPANMTAAALITSSPGNNALDKSLEKSLDRFGSLDSSDTFLSCATHPFPSQGSLAGLEELAAVGSMAANGSMPAVNIPSFNNNGVYVNPFDPTGARTCKKQQHQPRVPPIKRGGSYTPKGTLTPSPQGSPHNRRVRIGRRSASSDVELVDFESDFSAANREAYHEDLKRHKRNRLMQQQVRSRSDKFEQD